jgi:hypothetical protein
VNSSQSGYEPGATVQLTATIAESGVPLLGNASVWAEVTTPSRHVLRVNLVQSDQGIYGASCIAAEPGIYSSRIRASGTSRRGLPFLREQTLTNAVWIGGNNPSGPGKDDGLCHLLNCLFGRKGVITPHLEDTLRHLGIDLNGLRKCLAECAQSRIPANERTSTARAALPSGTLLGGE